MGRKSGSDSPRWLEIGFYETFTSSVCYHTEWEEKGINILRVRLNSQISHPVLIVFVYIFIDALISLPLGRSCSLADPIRERGRFADA